LGIILPMVRHQTEIDGILAMVEEVRKEFPVSRFPLKIGTMVETVELANHIPTLHGVDFLTIGSNDLVCDLHQSCREDALYSPEWFQEPDFLETVRAILDQTTLPVFLCGEAANHPESANRLSDLGIHQFCPAPHCLGIYGGQPAGTGTVLRPNPPIPRRQ